MTLKSYARNCRLPTCYPELIAFISNLRALCILFLRPGHHYNSFGSRYQPDNGNNQTLETVFAVIYWIMKEFWFAECFFRIISTNETNLALSIYLCLNSSWVK